MSGGHFEYQQYRIQDIIDSIEELVNENNTLDEFGCCRNFSDETLEEFKTGIKLLKVAQVYAQRIDWLVSGDDSEVSFHKRLANDLHKIREKDNF